MSYQPAENLNNRTFGGLIVAQFLAGFNDQAIHAAAMFYAIHTKILAQESAITLMPVLFYSPWAIFCTLAGYFADRYSKTMTLRVWKMAEVGISLIMIAGFLFGGAVGLWLIMACVFLMGTHAAFFAPAKYGAMPEILRPHIMSRGNGILESTTFLASILGTVCGGLLFFQFRDNEVMIGVVLLILSSIGAAASFMIVWLPAASPDRPFPTNQFKPIFNNLKVIFRSRPLALAVLGIAFFVFMVAYMRASMYMHGETRNPRWDEEKTSWVVATVALGVGLGSPFAGFLSGGKVELGLVPIGCVGMILALLGAAIAIEKSWVLVIALIAIGFFSGFYMVPLYTLLQLRAPKKSKGELVATSNFINVTGAITASLLFFVLVQLSRLLNITPELPLTVEAEGKIVGPIELNKQGKIRSVSIRLKNGDQVDFFLKKEKNRHLVDQLADVAKVLAPEIDEEPIEVSVIDFDDNLFEMLSGMPQEGDEVVVSSYMQGVRKHFVIRLASQPVRKVYNNEALPRYLFIGAALMTLAILFLLCRKLPDFFVRSLFWFKTLGKFRLKAVGMQNLPTEGPVILATNCDDLERCLQLVSATDRTTKVVLVEHGTALHDGVLLRRIALRHNIIIVHPKSPESWTAAKEDALHTLRGGHLLAISVANEEQSAALEEFLRDLDQQTRAPVLPAYCGSLDVPPPPGVTPRVRVVFGEPSAPGTPGVNIEHCQQAIASLEKWIRANDDTAGTEGH